MSLLSKMVLCSMSYKGRLFDDFCSLPKEVTMSLKAVTKGQRHKFEKYGIVPLPVLRALWLMGFMPGKEPPINGMKIATLIDYLHNSRYETDQRAKNGQWLIDKIVAEEFIGVNL